MSDWSWVALGFAVSYGSLAGFAAVLARRLARVRRERERLR